MFQTFIEGIVSNPKTTDKGHHTYSKNRTKLGWTDKNGNNEYETKYRFFSNGSSYSSSKKDIKENSQNIKVQNIRHERRNL